MCIYILVICGLNLKRFVCVFSEISSMLLSRDNRGRFLGWGRCTMTPAFHADLQIS